MRQKHNLHWKVKGTHTTRGLQFQYRTSSYVYIIIDQLCTTILTIWKQCFYLCWTCWGRAGGEDKKRVLAVGACEHSRGRDMLGGGGISNSVGIADSPFPTRGVRGMGTGMGVRWPGPIQICLNAMCRLILFLLTYLFLTHLCMTPLLCAPLSLIITSLIEMLYDWHL